MMIDIDKAVQWLKENYRDFWGYVEYNDDPTEMFDLFRKDMAVKEPLTTAEKQVWHKVSEELPKETCECLVCWETVKHERKWTQIVMFRRDTNNPEVWYFEDDEDSVVCPDYWMPIPDLPKEN